MPAVGGKLEALSAYPNYPLAFVILRRSRRIWANAIEILHFAALRSEWQVVVAGYSDWI
jgi:hypothetical protein